MLPLVRSFQGDERIEGLFAAWSAVPHTARLQGGWDADGMGRYTVLGLDPYLVLTSTGARVTRIRGGEVETITADPFLELDKEYRQLETPFPEMDASIPFQGGAIGFLGYGLRRYVERVPAKAADDVPTPEMYFAFYDVVCVYDHFQQQGFLYSSGMPEKGETARRRAASRLAEIWDSMQSAPAPARKREIVPESVRPDLVLSERHSAMDKATYIHAVKRAKEYIAAGDVYQVNIAQRFAVPATFAADTLFDVLRRVNPSPFGAFIKGPDWTVISVSPERFFLYDGTYVETRPIKGTRPRGKTEADDERLKRELLASAKDRAEHVMIVDLERNDLGRFCDYTSVRVPELMVCEAHPTVWHLVSTVRGRPRPGVSLIEGVKSAFPGGSITGAPKVRAMEIIDELEPVARGVYTGSIGYLAQGGHIDLNIAIRTLTLAQGKAYFHVGGGIVADSDPESEYQETLDKGLGIARALDIASQWASDAPEGERY